MEISGASSDLGNGYEPKLALTDVSFEHHGFWHSKQNRNVKEWISFKMPASKMIWKVLVIDRQSCCLDRFKNVEVTVGSSPNLQNPRQSCGTQSYKDYTKYM